MRNNEKKKEAKRAHPTYRHEIPSSHSSNKLQYITSTRYHHPGATNYLTGMIYPSSYSSKPSGRHEISIILQQTAWQPWDTHHSVAANRLSGMRHHHPVAPKHPTGMRHITLQSRHETPISSVTAYHFTSMRYLSFCLLSRDTNQFCSGQPL